MTLAPGTEQLLQWFMILAGILLIPVVVGLILVLFKLAFLIHSASEFVTLAKYELSPLVKELRLIVDHVETIGQKASSGVQELGHSLQQTAPIIRKGVDQVKVGASALITGISRSFGQSS